MNSQAPYSDLSEQELLQRAREGDREAFGELYLRYVQQIYNYIYYRTGHPQEAEDLTARVFLRALRHIHRYEERGAPFVAYLYRIAHNLVSNWHRDNNHRQEIPLDGAFPFQAPNAAPETQLIQNEERERLLQAIRRLPAERQQLLILKFVDRLSNAEIGQIMGRSESAIKSLYHRTLISLRKILVEMEQKEKEVKSS